jgi:large subunit ribosomal protein L30
MYAVIRIRGTVSVKPDTRKTLEYLNLRRANNLSIWPEVSQFKKAIKKIEPMVTFGKIDDTTLEKLIEKRGKMIEGKLDTKKILADLKSGKTANEVGLFNCFTLSPPKKGFERKGVKKPYTMGGAYGDRKEAINELILRMI